MAGPKPPVNAGFAARLQAPAASAITPPFTPTGQSGLPWRR